MPSDYDQLIDRCNDLVDVKHEVSVALEEIESGEVADGIGRLKELIK